MLPMNEYLEASPCVDSEHPRVVALAHELTDPDRSAIDNALSLYYWVRDKIRYNPYSLGLTREELSASSTATCPPSACGSQ